MDRTRVVITGMGAITPIGNSADEFWTSCLAGRSGIDRITRFDAGAFSVRIGAEVKGFDPEAHIDKVEARKMDRFTQFAVAVSDAALKDSGLDLGKEDPTRIGVLIGSGVGGIETFEVQHTNLISKGPSRVSPYFVPMMIADMAAGMVSMRHGLKGPNFATVSACASGAHALGEALRILQRGEANVMLAGGGEAAVTPMTVSGFASMKALSKRNEEPLRASRPFDRDRDGFVLGEGAALFVLETLEHAAGRGARIRAELAGYGASADAYHVTAPAPDAEGAMASMAIAVRDAGLALEDIEYVNAHGTSTPHNDRLETVAIKNLFKAHAYRLAVSSTKSMIGHLLGAAGAVELVACVMSVETGWLHPTVNQENPDPDCDLDYVPNTARQAKVRAALSNSFGFGGHNASLVIRAFQG